MRRTTIKQRMDPALTALLEPGDRIVAGFQAQTGLSPNWHGILAYATAAGAVYGLWQTAVSSTVHSSGAGFFVYVLPGIVAVALTLRQKQFFFAATERYLICYELAGLGHPFRPRFRVPLEAVQLTGRPSGPLTWRFPVDWRAMQYTAPGTGTTDIRCHIHRRWRHDVAKLLTQVQAGGGLVQTGQPAPLSAEALALPGSAQD